LAISVMFDCYVNYKYKERERDKDMKGRKSKSPTFHIVNSATVFPRPHLKLCFQISTNDILNQNLYIENHSNSHIQLTSITTVTWCMYS